MPIICIGPVCIPITAVVPLVLFVFKPIYNCLPKKYQETIDEWIKQCQLALNRCLRKIGWTKSKKEKIDEVTADDAPTTNGANGHQTARVQELKDEDEWDALLEQSKSQNLIFIAYFTSPLSEALSSSLCVSAWCKPCKEFYPVFEEMVNKSPVNWQFIKVDIDEFDEIALDYKAVKLPSFVKFEKGEPSGTVVGPNKYALAELFNN